MKYVAVMPWIYEPYKDECLACCKLDPLLLVDNTETNLGIMRSHNLGIDFMRAQDADWLIILSAAVRFGDAGGLDFVRALEHCTEHAVVNAEGMFGWHFMAFARETIEAAGRWDENFTPYGFDDVDYAIRIHKSRPGAIWSGIKDVDASDTTMAHSLELGGVYVDATPQINYLHDKWGGERGAPFDAFHDHPFDDPALSVRVWPKPTGLGPVDGASWHRAAPWPEQAKIR